MTSTNDGTISPFETAQAAYDRGHQDGIWLAVKKLRLSSVQSIEAEFETKLADKIGAFERALTALSKPQTSDINSLSLSLQAAVVKIGCGAHWYSN